MSKPFSGAEPIRVQPSLWQEDINIPNSTGILSPQTVSPQKYLNLAKSLWGIKLSVRFHVRFAVGATAPGTAAILNSEFPLGFIDRIGLSGISKYFGSLTRFKDFNHCTFWNYMNLFRTTSQKCIVSRNGAAYQQVQGNGSTQVAAPTNTANTNTDYDIIIESTIPFVPLMSLQKDVVTKQQAPFLLRGGATGAEIWKNVQLFLGMADYTGLFDKVTPADVTITFGAIQGTNTAGGTNPASGSPVVTLSLLPVLFGSSEAGGEAIADAYQVGKAVHYVQQQTIQSAVLTASVQTPTILQRLSVTQPHYLRLLIKTGLSPTNPPSNGVQSVMQTPSDSEFTHVEIRRNNKPIRFGDNVDIFNAKENFATKYDTVIPAGYFPVDFMHGFDLNSAVDVSGLTSDNWTANGASAGAAGQIGEVLEETFQTAA